MKRGIWQCFFLVILVCLFILLNNPVFKQKNVIPASPIANKIPSARETAKVSKVIDGDTIKVLRNNKEETVRLIGIDAPETVDPDKQAQCFGKEASAKAEEMLNGKTVILESDPTQGEKDKYGRLLRYVFLGDGTNFDELMVEEGFAREYTYINKAYKYMNEFRIVQDGAQNNKRGLWSACGI